MSEWQIKPKYPQAFATKFPELHPILLQLLYNRGLTDQKTIDEFLNPDYSQDLHDPFLLQDMQKAVMRIFKAIDNQEKIVIHGDYDVDGVTSSAILFSALTRLGGKPENIDVYIPHRVLEGYGLSTETVEDLADKKTNLILTVDCGITNNKEIKLANENHIDVIIVDHHHAPQNLPDAFANVSCSLPDDPYPFKHLCGAGVTFKLAQALFYYDSLPRDKRNSPITNHQSPITNNHSAFEKWLLDLVVLGTVADSVPLLGENRTLTKWGMFVLNKTNRPGLKELINVSGLTPGEMDTIDIGFRLGPRLNAAGRMDHANLAYQLLITQDPIEAIAAAGELDQKNKDRQKTTEVMMEEAKAQAEQQKNNKVIIIAGEDWSPGLIGLIAGRICEQYYRPTFVFGISSRHPEENPVGAIHELPLRDSSNDAKYVASGRSVPTFSIIEAIESVSQHLDHFGGHDQACGLTIFGEDNFNAFKQKINQFAKNILKPEDLIAKLDIEAEITLEEANWDLIDELEKLKPYGQDNPVPLFVTKNLTLESVDAIGKDQKTLRIQASQKKFIGFRLAETWMDKLTPGDKIDIVYELGINEWNGNREIQFKIEDLRLSKV